MSKYRNTGVSSVPWVWHLKIPDRAGMVRYWNFKSVGKVSYPAYPGYVPRVFHTGVRVGIVGMTSENTWSSRDDEALKSQNTELSSVSWVWYLKIPAPRWYGKYCAYLNNQYQVLTLPKVPQNALVSSKPIRMHCTIQQSWYDTRQNELNQRLNCNLVTN